MEEGLNPKRSPPSEQVKLFLDILNSTTTTTSTSSMIPKSPLNTTTPPAPPHLTDLSQPNFSPFLSNSISDTTTMNNSSRTTTTSYLSFPFHPSSSSSNSSSNSSSSSIPTHSPSFMYGSNPTTTSSTYPYTELPSSIANTSNGLPSFSSSSSSSSTTTSTTTTTSSSTGLDSIQQLLNAAMKGRQSTHQIKSILSVPSSASMTQLTDPPIQNQELELNLETLKPSSSTSLSPSGLNPVSSPNSSVFTSNLHIEPLPTDFHPTSPTSSSSSSTALVFQEEMQTKEDRRPSLDLAPHAIQSSTTPTLKLASSLSPTTRTTTTTTSSSSSSIKESTPFPPSYAFTNDEPTTSTSLGPPPRSSSMTSTTSTISTHMQPSSKYSYISPFSVLDACIDQQHITPPTTHATDTPPLPLASASFASSTSPQTVMDATSMPSFVDLTPSFTSFSAPKEAPSSVRFPTSFEQPSSSVSSSPSHPSNPPSPSFPVNPTLYPKSHVPSSTLLMNPSLQPTSLLESSTHQEEDALPLFNPTLASSSSSSLSSFPKTSTSLDTKAIVSASSLHFPATSTPTPLLPPIQSSSLPSPRLRSRTTSSTSSNSASSMSNRSDITDPSMHSPSSVGSVHFPTYFSKEEPLYLSEPPSQAASSFPFSANFQPLLFDPVSDLPSATTTTSTLSSFPSSTTSTHALKHTGLAQYHVNLDQVPSMDFMNQTSSTLMGLLPHLYHPPPLHCQFLQASATEIVYLEHHHLVITLVATPDASPTTYHFDALLPVTSMILASPYLVLVHLDRVSVYSLDPTNVRLLHGFQFSASTPTSSSSSSSFQSTQRVSPTQRKKNMDYTSFAFKDTPRFSLGKKKESMEDDHFVRVRKALVLPSHPTLVLELLVSPLWNEFVAPCASSSSTSTSSLSNQEKEPTLGDTFLVVLDLNQVDSLAPSSTSHSSSTSSSSSSSSNSSPRSSRPRPSSASSSTSSSSLGLSMDARWDTLTNQKKRPMLQNSHRTSLTFTSNLHTPSRPLYDEGPTTATMFHSNFMDSNNSTTTTTTLHPIHNNDTNDDTEDILILVHEDQPYCTKLSERLSYLTAAGLGHFFFTCSRYSITLWRGVRPSRTFTLDVPITSLFPLSHSELALCFLIGINNNSSFWLISLSRKPSVPSQIGLQLWLHSSVSALSTDVTASFVSMSQETDTITEVQQNRNEGDSHLDINTPLDWHDSSSSTAWFTGTWLILKTSSSSSSLSNSKLVFIQFTPQGQCVAMYQIPLHESLVTLAWTSSSLLLVMQDRILEMDFPFINGFTSDMISSGPTQPIRIVPELAPLCTFVAHSLRPGSSALRAIAKKPPISTPVPSSKFFSSSSTTPSQVILPTSSSTASSASSKKNKKTKQGRTEPFQHVTPSPPPTASPLPPSSPSTTPLITISHEDTTKASVLPFMTSSHVSSSPSSPHLVSTSLSPSLPPVSVLPPASSLSNSHSDFSDWKQYVDEKFEAFQTYFDKRMEVHQHQFHQQLELLTHQLQEGFQQTQLTLTQVLETLPSLQRSFSQPDLTQSFLDSFLPYLRHTLQTQFTSTLIPAYERASQEMFRQLAETLQPLSISSESSMTPVAPSLSSFPLTKSIVETGSTSSSSSFSSKLRPVTTNSAAVPIVKPKQKKEKPELSMSSSVLPLSYYEEELRQALASKESDSVLYLLHHWKTTSSPSIFPMLPQFSMNILNQFLTHFPVLESPALFIDLLDLIFPTLSSYFDDLSSTPSLNSSSSHNFPSSHHFNDPSLSLSQLRSTLRYCLTQLEQLDRLGTLEFQQRQRVWVLNHALKSKLKP